MPEFGKTILGKDIAPFDEKSYEIVPAGLIVGLGLSGPWNIHLFFTLPHKLHVKDDTFSMTGLVSSLPPVIPLRTACADCIMHLTGVHHHPSRQCGHPIPHGDFKIADIDTFGIATPSCGHGCTCFAKYALAMTMTETAHEAQKAKARAEGGKCFCECCSPPRTNYFPFGCSPDLDKLAADIKLIAPTGGAPGTTDMERP